MENNEITSIVFRNENVSERSSDIQAKAQEMALNIILMTEYMFDGTRTT